MSDRICLMNRAASSRSARGTTSTSARGACSPPSSWATSTCYPPPRPPGARSVSRLCSGLRGRGPRFRSMSPWPERRAVNLMVRPENHAPPRSWRGPPEQARRGGRRHHHGRRVTPHPRQARHRASLSPPYAADHQGSSAPRRAPRCGSASGRATAVILTRATDPAGRPVRARACPPAALGSCCPILPLLLFLAPAFPDPGLAAALASAQRSGPRGQGGAPLYTPVRIAGLHPVLLIGTFKIAGWTTTVLPRVRLSGRISARHRRGRTRAAP